VAVEKLPIYSRCKTEWPLWTNNCETYQEQVGSYEEFSRKKSTYTSYLKAALPKAGYNRNFPKEVIYEPTSLLGADIHHLYTTQLIVHLDVLLRHGGQETITGQLLTGNLETTKLELGLPGPLFGQDFSRFGKLVTSSWIKGV
jgi:hypothetical protein